LGVPDWQLPALQTSPKVQAFPSSQGAVLKVCAQSPVVASQESSVQTFPSSQFLEAPGAQEPFEHTSPKVQAFPSVQGNTLLVLEQFPLTLSQESSVQGFPSSQSVVFPGTHVPLKQVSLYVQVFPSLQGEVLKSWLQVPVVVSQESSVQPFPSSQDLRGPETQLPF